MSRLYWLRSEPLPCTSHQVAYSHWKSVWMPPSKPLSIAWQMTTVLRTSQRTSRAQSQLEGGECSSLNRSVKLGRKCLPTMTWSSAPSGSVASFFQSTGHLTHRSTWRAFLTTRRGKLKGRLWWWGWSLWWLSSQFFHEHPTGCFKSHHLTKRILSVCVYVCVCVCVCVCRWIV